MTIGSNHDCDSHMKLPKLMMKIQSDQASRYAMNLDFDIMTLWADAGVDSCRIAGF